MIFDVPPPWSPSPTPPPAQPPAPPPAYYPPSVPRNANGETLAEAEAAVLALVAGGMLGADALALHPLPPGTSAEEALRFLSTLPQTVYTIGEPGGTVIGPPIAELEAEFGPDAEDDQELAWEDDPATLDDPALFGFERQLDVG